MMRKRVSSLNIRVVVVAAVTWRLMIVSVVVAVTASGRDELVGGLVELVLGELGGALELA